MLKGTSLLSLIPRLIDLIWRKGTPFEEMTARTAFTDGLLAEVFLSRKLNAKTAPGIISLSPLSLATDGALGASATG